MRAEKTRANSALKKLQKEKEKETSELKTQLAASKVQLAKAENKSKMNHAALQAAEAEARGGDSMVATLALCNAGMTQQKGAGVPFLLDKQVASTPLMGMAPVGGAAAPTLGMLPNPGMAFGQMLAMSQMHALNSQNDAQRAAAATVQQQVMAKEHREQLKQLDASAKAQAVELMKFSESMAQKVSSTAIQIATAGMGSASASASAPATEGGAGLLSPDSAAAAKLGVEIIRLKRERDAIDYTNFLDMYDGDEEMAKEEAASQAASLERKLKHHKGKLYGS